MVMHMENIQKGFATVPSLTETFRRMKPGSWIIVKNKDYKISSGRSAKHRLVKEGIFIEISENGMVNEWKATRIR